MFFEGFSEIDRLLAKIRFWIESSVIKLDWLTPHELVVVDSRILQRKKVSLHSTVPPLVWMGDTTMNFSQARPRVIKGHLRANGLLLQPENLGKTTVLLVLPMTAPLDYVFRRRTLTQQQLWPLQWPFQFFCGNTVDLTFIYLGIGMTRLILFLSNCLFHLLFIPKQY